MVRTAVPPVAEAPPISSLSASHTGPLVPLFSCGPFLEPGADGDLAALQAGPSPWQPAFPLFCWDGKMAVPRKVSGSMTGCPVPAPPSRRLDDASCTEPTVR